MVVHEHFEHKRGFNEDWRRMLQKAAEIELGITKRKDFDTKLHDFLKDEAANYGLTKAHFLRELNGYLRKGEEYIEMQKLGLKTLKTSGDTKNKVQRILAGIPASPEIGIWPEKKSKKSNTEPSKQDMHDARTEIMRLAYANKSLTADNDKLLKAQEATQNENNDLTQRIADLEAQLAAGTPSPQPTPTQQLPSGPSQKDLDDTNDKITNLEAEKEALNSAKKFTESQNADLTQQVAELEAERDLLKSATESADKEIREFQQKIIELEEKIAAGTDTGISQAELDAANQEILDLRDQIEKFADLEQEIKRLEARKEAQANRIEELKEKVRTLEDKDLKSISEVSGIRHQLQDTIAELEESKTKLEQTRTTLEEAKEKQTEAEQQVTSIQAELDAANELNEQNTTTITEISEKLTKKTNQLETLRGRYRTLKETSDSNIEEKETQIAGLQTEIEEINTKKTTLTDRVKELEKDLATTKNSLQESQTEIDRTREDLSTQKALFKTEKEDHQETKDELERFGEEINRLDEKVDDLRSERDEYKFHYEDEKQRAAKFSEELESTKQELKTTHKQLDAAIVEKASIQDKLNTANNQIKEMRNHISRIEGEKNSALEKIKQLREDRDAANKKVEDIKDEYNKLSFDYEELELARKNLNKQLQQANELNERLEAKLEEAESLLSRKDDELLEVKGQISVVEAERNDMRKRLKEAADEIIAQKRTIDDLNQEATDLSNSLATAETTVFQQKSTIEQLRSNLEAASEEIEDEIRRRRLAENEASEVTKERNHYRAQLSEAEQDISSLSGQVEQLRTEKEKAIGALKTKTEDFAKVSVLLDTYKEENKNLKAENARINKEISELESDLSDAIEAVRATDRTRNISEKEKAKLTKHVQILEKQLEDFRGAKKELEKQTRLVKELDRLSKKDVIEIGRLKEQIKDLEWKKESTKKENKRLHEAFEANKQSISQRPITGASQINKIKAHRNRRLGATGKHKRKKPNNRKDIEITNDDLE